MTRDRTILIKVTKIIRSQNLLIPSSSCDLDLPNKMIWEHYTGKTLFLTGTTGFVGSAILLRLISQAQPEKIYVLCRGGIPSAAKKWNNLLPDILSRRLLQDPRIVVLDGDMSAIDFGLSDVDLDILRNDVHFIIHAASTIHLRMKLRELSYSVIAPSIWLARLAFSSKKLERFVFISTAYCNAHLWQIQKDTNDVLIKENIYPLLEGENPFLHAPQAWQDIQKLGQTEEFARNDFPWGYAYAKHLTERLLLFFASQKESMHKLLIVRPSIIGPAQEHPFVGFSTATSTPTTSCATAFVLHPGRSMVFASRLPDGSLQSTIDEVPIDVVVDRTLAHLALGTNGCVHAVGGRKTRVTIDEWARANNDERRIPWDVKVKWIDADWNSKEVCQLARIFKIIGTNYGFDESKTELIDSQLVGHDLKLFADRKPYEVASRRGMIRELGIDMAKRKGWPVWFIKLLARKANQNGDIIMIGDIEVASEKKL